mmetsp:Transcript_9966/g.18722  ORF Transcript_9966/g.18722 Transcript_9966/m.18722 type:complete len:226 (+) Transcript_9966:378-1055(+)
MWVVQRQQVRERYADTPCFFYILVPYQNHSIVEHKRTASWSQIRALSRLLQGYFTQSACILLHVIKSFLDSQYVLYFMHGSTYEDHSFAKALFSFSLAFFIVHCLFQPAQRAAGRILNRRGLSPSPQVVKALAGVPALGHQHRAQVWGVLRHSRPKPLQPRLGLATLVFYRCFLNRFRFRVQHFHRLLVVVRGASCIYRHALHVSAGVPLRSGVAALEGPHGVLQ